MQGAACGPHEKPGKHGIGKNPLGKARGSARQAQPLPAPPAQNRFFRKGKGGAKARPVGMFFLGNAAHREKAALRQPASQRLS